MEDQVYLAGLEHCDSAADRRMPYQDKRLPEGLKTFDLLVLPPELVAFIVEKAAESLPPPFSEGDTTKSGLEGPRRALAYAPELCNLALASQTLYGLCLPHIYRYLVFSLPGSRSPLYLEDGKCSEGMHNILNPLRKLQAMASSPGATSVQVFRFLGRPQYLLPFYLPPRRVRCGREQAGNYLIAAVGCFTSLTFLELTDIDEDMTIACLRAAPPTLIAISLSRAENTSPLLPAGLTIPKLPQLRAIKIFEYPEWWCELVAATTHLEHLCLWFPTTGFGNLDWLTDRQLATIEVLNLDGFKRRPQMFPVFIRRIQAYLRDGTNPPLPLYSLDIEHDFEPSSLDLLAEAFSGLSALRTLAISCIPHFVISPQLLGGLAAVFSSVQFLTVMVDAYDRTSWPGDIIDYARALSSMPDLRSFGCNHSTFEREDLRELLAVSLPFFRECRNLKRVIKIDALYSNRTTGSVAVRREDAVDEEEPGHSYREGLVDMSRFEGGVKMRTRVGIDLSTTLMPFERNWAGA